jgi:AcrR family transcriptional regulator
MPAKSTKQAASATSVAERTSRSARQPETSRRDLVLDVATHHLVMRGFEGVSMRDIAAESGITIATLYFHVGSKEQLFLDVLDRQRGRLWEGLQAAVAAAGSGWRDRLEAALRFHIVIRCEPGSGPLLRVGELQSMRPELRDRYLERRDEYEQLFRDLITGGIAAGEFANVDVTVAAAGILGLGNTVAHWYRPGRLSPDEIATQYVALLFAGLDRR